MLILLALLASLWLLGWRGTLALLGGLWLLSVVGAPLYAAYGRVVQTPGAVETFAAGVAGVLVGGTLVWRWVYNRLVQADFARDVESARKKRDARLI